MAWKLVARSELPYWALSLDSVWQHSNKHFLSGTTNSGSTLWELRTPEGTAITSQLELPFENKLDGAPLKWAEIELAYRKIPS
jgi:hypothetical protein